MTSITHRTSRPASAGLLLATFALVGLNGLGLVPDTPSSTAFAAFALLIFGLPHGAFDLALLRRAASERAPAVAITALYLGCAAAMYLAWRTGPVFALAAFLAMAMAHFAEDWEACGSRFIAGGIAVAAVSAPALLHAGALRGLFVLLTGDPAAALLADVLLLIAPAALSVALVGALLLWQAGRTDLAIGALCGLAAMLLLPPVIGFALFFCLVHSPLQFRQHAGELGLRGVRQWRGIVVPLSLGGLGIAVAVYLQIGGVSLSTGVFASSFMTLSILTAPHMFAPIIVARLRR